MTAPIIANLGGGGGGANDHVQNTDTGTTETDFQINSGASGVNLQDNSGGLKVSETKDTNTRPTTHFQQAGEVLEDGSSHTGVDETMNALWEAIKFTASADATSGAFQVRLKVSAGLSNGSEFLSFYIYNDNSGSPGNRISSNETTTFYGTLTTSYAVVTAKAEASFTSGTDYWLVLKQSSAPTGGNILIDSEATGTALHANSADGSSWNTENNKHGYHKILSRNYSASYINCQVHFGAYVESEVGEGVSAYSTANIGCRGQSVGSFGVYGRSGYSYGVFARSQDDIGLYCRGVGYYGLWAYSDNYTPGAFDRVGDGTLVDFLVDGSIEGNIDASSGTVAYNAHLASHYTQLKDSQSESDFTVGKVVVATGEIISCEAPTVKDRSTWPPTEKAYSGDVSGVENREYFPHVDFTTDAADKRVYGVWHGKLCNTADKGTFGENSKAIHTIASSGLFKIRVTDTAGDIENGDYLQSSTRSGEAEKQADDTQHNYTVAKALQDVDFSSVAVDPVLGYKWKLIPCILLCG